MDRCLGIIRGGVVKRIRSAEWQQHCRAQRIEVHKIAQHENGQDNVDLFVPNCEVKRATQVIPQTINKTLPAFPVDLTKKVVL